MLRLLLLLISLVPSAGADAATSPWRHAQPIDGAPPLSGRLISPVNALGSEQTVWAGLEIRLADGWKTYWRSPGEVGLPPAIEWQKSTGIDQVTLHYPAPTRFTAFEIENFGYESHVVFPLEITRGDNATSMLLKLQASFLVCSDICVPADIDMNLMLPSGDPAIDEPTAQTLSQYSSRIPDDGVHSGLSLDFVSANEDGSAISIAAASRDGFENPDLFAELLPKTAFARPEIRLLEGGARLEATIALTAGRAETGRPISITLVDGERAATHATNLQGPVANVASDRGIAVILALAFLGGLILNIMPCVLPVLSLKLAGVIAQRERSLSRVRASFLSSAAGIVASMLAIGLATIGFKSLGAAVGWGVQFQNPIFLIFMIVLLTLFAANLAGLFEIRLPSALATPLSSGGSESGLVGDFVTGAFATLLATPCSAPFLGTAVGFALSGSNGDIALVFLMLGVGLATPYWLIALRPSLVRLLPRPGGWMIWFKCVLSAALILTTVWLLWVLATVENPAASLTLALIMVSLFAILTIAKLSRSASIKRAISATSCLLVALSFLTPNAAAYLNADVDAGDANMAATVWTTFEQDRIAKLVAAGQTVFVDVTADWCITCKANKFLVLDTDEIAALLTDDSITPMQADWTSPDSAIASFLQVHGRYGIPFNIVYGPGAPYGVPLPELLTSAAVRAAIDQARARS